MFHSLPYKGLKIHMILTSVMFECLVSIKLVNNKLELFNIAKWSTVVCKYCSQ